ncbi:transcription elongation factor TFIIS [Coemansia sp. RSA 2052]|nr:transcription elongation factor TFIIS [Coemansia sp. RSA 2052]
MSDEIKTLCKALSSALEVDKKSDLKELLNKLYAIRVDEKLLRATGAGQVVGKLRNYEEPSIAVLAKKVVHKWKKDVLAANPRSSTGPAAGATPSSGSPTPSSAQAQRTAASDEAAIPQTGDSVRDKCAELLYNSLAIDSNADSDLLAKRASAIERIEFEKAASTTTTYKARIRSLCLNLRDKKNPDLRSNLVEGGLTVERFCSMTSEEMASKELKETIEQMKEENLFKAKGAGRTAAVTDQFRCGRCKSRKCTYYQMQTRSADEPMTTFVTCTNCDNNWKFS